MKMFKNNEVPAQTLNIGNSYDPNIVRKVRKVTGQKLVS